MRAQTYGTCLARHWRCRCFFWLVGLPLAFLATGLRFMPLARGADEHSRRALVAGRPHQDFPTSRGGCAA